ncbi:MAG: Wzz/FepE/Etk N-terminal domain-containing protein [Syntrophotaleaceae bacterium]
MSDHQNISEPYYEEKSMRSSIPDAEDEINLLEYLLVIVKHKKMILWVCSVAFVLTCIISLMLPNIYTSTARILPPNESKGGLSAMLGGMGDLAALAGISVGGSSGDLYVGMLKSRTVADAIIDRFDLLEVYDQKYRVKAYGKLEDNVQITVGKDDGIVIVSVDDEDPERAAAMANAFVEELKKANVKINLSSAGRERLFLEERLDVVKEDLLKAEQRLQEFQKEHKAIKIDDQASAIIEAIAQLKGELASKEVQLGVLRSSQTEQNPEIIALKESIVQIKGQLRKLEQSPVGQGVSEDIFIATSDVPELGIQYARVLRDFKVQETLFELLTKQYEVAKINEAKNTSTIQILDDAAVPDRKSKPKRSLIVMAVTACVGFFAIMTAFVREYLAVMPEDDRQRWAEIKQEAKFR